VVLKVGVSEVRMTDLAWWGAIIIEGFWWCNLLGRAVVPTGDSGFVRAAPTEVSCCVGVVPAGDGAVLWGTIKIRPRRIRGASITALLLCIDLMVTLISIIISLAFNTLELMRYAPYAMISASKNRNWRHAHGWGTVSFTATGRKKSCKQA